VFIRPCCGFGGKIYSLIGEMLVMLSGPKGAEGEAAPIHSTRACYCKG
jgi:hypothetical protein